MAFDDFVIEDNLVSCLRTNEVDRQNSGREEYSRLQIGEGEKTAGLYGVSALKFKKNSCHPTLPPHHCSNNHITMQNSSSGLLCTLKAECVGEKNQEGRWRWSSFISAIILIFLQVKLVA